MHPASANFILNRVLRPNLFRIPRFISPMDCGINAMWLKPSLSPRSTLACAAMRVERVRIPTLTESLDAAFRSAPGAFAPQPWSVGCQYDCDHVWIRHICDAPFCDMERTATPRSRSVPPILLPTRIALLLKSRLAHTATPFPAYRGRGWPYHSPLDSPPARRHVDTDGR